MLSPTIFIFSLFLISSNALSVHQVLDSDVVPPTSSQSSGAIGPKATLSVVNAYIAPDGYNRSATLVNGVYPAPLIQAETNEEFSLHVLNELTNPDMPLQTSIHWHGIFQHRTNWADGVSYVTQCPLRQQEAFVQQFNVANQSGTYWYHSHYSTQYCDGLRGALVIYDPHDPLKYLYDVDDETTVITISDWYHISSSILGQIYGQAVVANSTLINGLGRYPGGPAVPLSVINVQQGLRYRFRLVATSCDSSYNVSIDGHSMTVIEVDGNEVDPVEVDLLTIYAAQRYSVVVTANQTGGNFWFRALSAEPTLSTFEGGVNLAILRYDGAPDEDPTTQPNPNPVVLSESSLHPLINPAAPGIPGLGNADVTFSLDPGITAQGNFTFNGTPFVNPPVPVLLQILSGRRHPTELMPKDSIYELPQNKVIEINFPDPTNAPGGPHPIHLHGHAFSVVRVSGTNETNFVNPVRRDVVSIGNQATDNVTIRFVTDNPGPWFLHCHIDWHLNHGFAVVMAEAVNETAKQEHPPTDWFQLCAPGQQWGQTALGLLGS